MATRRTSKAGDSPAAQLLRRVAVVAGVLAVGWFVVEGGEWGTVDLIRQREKFDSLEAEVAQLERDVDSLRAEYKELRTDNMRLEREAREKYGMVRDRELLYWIREPRDVDSTSVSDSVRSAPRG